MSTSCSRIFYCSVNKLQLHTATDKFHIHDIEWKNRHKRGYTVEVRGCKTVGRGLWGDEMFRILIWRVAAHVCMHSKNSWSHTLMICILFYIYVIHKYTKKFTSPSLPLPKKWAVSVNLLNWACVNCNRLQYAESRVWLPLSARPCCGPPFSWYLTCQTGQVTFWHVGWVRGTIINPKVQCKYSFISLRWRICRGSCPRSILTSVQE